MILALHQHVGISLYITYHLFIGTLIAAGVDLRVRDKSVSSIMSTIGLAVVVALNVGIDTFGDKNDYD